MTVIEKIRSRLQAKIDQLTAVQNRDHISGLHLQAMIVVRDEIIAPAVAEGDDP